MPRFKSKEEYEKWKAERAKEIKENPNKNRASVELKSDRQTAKKVAISSIQKTLAKASTMLHNWVEASKRRKAEKNLRQQAQLQKFKNSNRKMNCPSCRTSLSINAVACPKCGQPITDMARLDEIARINRNHIIIAAVIIGFILLGLLGKLLPERTVSNSSSTSIAISEAEKTAIIKAFNAMTPESKTKLIANIEKILDDEIKYFHYENTGDQEVDSIFLKIQKLHNEVSAKISDYKSKRAEREKRAENLEDLYNRMQFAPRGSEYLEQLNHEREIISSFNGDIANAEQELSPIKRTLQDVLYKINPENKYFANASSKKEAEATGMPKIKVTMTDDETLIPAGEFEMGGSGTRAFTPRKVSLDAYYIDRYPVTVAKYMNFSDATGRKMREQPSWNKDNHPVIVNWFEASAYCEWAEKRLPSEAEWEKAAKAGMAGLKFPWGNELTHEHANYEGVAGRDKWEFTSPVGSFPPNDYGLYDMVGNVDQWCSDWFDYNNLANSNGIDRTGSYRVLRGGNWWLSGKYPQHLDVSSRSEGDPSRAGVAAPVTGFRCARFLKSTNR